MPATALALALAAALVHAGWNLLLSGSEDTHSTAAIAMAAGALLFALPAALTWRMQAAAVPYIVASSALETLYLALLAAGYARLAMSFVYPIARGSAPVLVLIAGALALGASLSAAAVAGVVLVAGGIVLVRGLRAPRGPRDLALALAIGGCIASYTLVDKHGILHASPLAYIETVFSATAAAYLVGALRVRGAGALRAALGARSVLAGAGFFGAYALVLSALRLAPAASVAAVRESSVVIAAAVLALTGRERVTPERLAGALAVAGGIALVSLG
jgi:drug/metabolite transporter (DMT)-like permease